MGTSGAEDQDDMTRTVAQVVAPQTCQSTPNSHHLQPGAKTESAANAINPMLQKLWSTLVPSVRQLSMPS